MIDLHCHVLPGVDDGPASMADAIEMVLAAERAGISTMVATSHVDESHDWVDAELIAEGVATLREELAARRIGVEILPGAEIGLWRAAAMGADELATYRLGPGAHVLVEAPLATAAGDVPALFRRVAAHGHPIVIAHPERSPAFQRAPGDLARLVGEGMLAQVTAASLTGDYGRIPQRFAADLVKRRLVHVAASDAHDARRRPPDIAGPLHRAGLDALRSRLAEDVPGAILRPASPRESR